MSAVVSLIVNSLRENRLCFNIQRRPRPANSSRHVLDINDYEAAVIGLVAGKANAGSPSSRSDVFKINSHIYSVVCSER